METSSTGSQPDFPPTLPPDSPGSSVSTRLQEEYEELLKYAVVVPDYKPLPGQGALQRGGVGTQNDLLTVRAAPSSSALLHDLPGQRAAGDRITADKAMEELPNFGGQSPIEVHAQGSTFDEQLTSASEDGLGGGRCIKTLFPDGQREGEGEEMGERDVVGLVYAATVDHDVARVESCLDQWCLDLKRNVLAEFSQAKIMIEQKSRQELMKETNRLRAEKAQLTQELDELKEFLHSFQRSMERKDAIIANLTRAVYRQRDKVELMRNFCNWRLNHNDVKREDGVSAHWQSVCATHQPGPSQESDPRSMPQSPRMIPMRRRGPEVRNLALKLATQHYHRCLNRRVLRAWFSLIHQRWRQHVERSCQQRAQQVCVQLTADYEAKIAAMREELNSARSEISGLHVQRSHYEEAMKKAFMRGVCALNMEAMSMFHGEDGADAPQMLQERLAEGELSDNLDITGQVKDAPGHKAMPLTSDLQPPKVVTSQGSRSAGLSASVPSAVSPRQTGSRPSSSTSTTTTSAMTGTTTQRKKGGRVVGRGGGGASVISPSLRPPQASVVVERHCPVNKQTIGQATAARYPRNQQSQHAQGPDMDRFGRPAGQGIVGSQPLLHTVRVVE